MRQSRAHGVETYQERNPAIKKSKVKNNTKTTLTFTGDHKQLNNVVFLIRDRDNWKRRALAYRDIIMRAQIYAQTNVDKLKGVK